MQHRRQVETSSARGRRSSRSRPVHAFVRHVHEVDHRHRLQHPPERCVDVPRRKRRSDLAGPRRASAISSLPTSPAAKGGPRADWSIGNQLTGRSRAPLERQMLPDAGIDRMEMLVTSSVWRRLRRLGHHFGARDAAGSRPVLARRHAQRFRQRCVTLREANRRPPGANATMTRIGLRGRPAGSGRHRECPARERQCRARSACSPALRQHVRELRAHALVELPLERATLGNVLRFTRPHARSPRAIQRRSSSDSSSDRASCSAAAQDLEILARVHARAQRPHQSVMLAGRCRRRPRSPTCWCRRRHDIATR